MALVAKMPLAQAPGMGLNALVGTIIGGAMGFAFSYGNAMVFVLISGIILKETKLCHMLMRYLRK